VEEVVVATEAQVHLAFKVPATGGVAALHVIRGCGAAVGKDNTLFAPLAENTEEPRSPAALEEIIRETECDGPAFGLPPLLDG
jgi:hypothetical protein